MLLEFKCRNFLSIKDEISIDLTTVNSYSEHKETHIINSEREELSVLKSAVIYGSNGGGKSNFMRGLNFMDSFIHESFKKSLDKDEEREPWNFYFRLSTETINKPSMFEVSFLVEKSIYRYGFELQNWTIISEWLYKTEKRETKLFERTGNDFEINETGFPEGKRFPEVNANVLFLSHLAQYNEKESSKVFIWFKNLNVMDGLNNNFVANFTRKTLEEDKKFKKWLSLALRFLEIESVEINDNKLIALHPKFNENLMITEYVKFQVDKDESHGTKKLIYILGALYDTLLHGRKFFVDEFDSKLHPNLTYKLVKLFHEYNVNGAQFVITAHDPTLLDKEVYRRDQIWFLDKDQFGASKLYPLSDFKANDGLRSVSNFRNMYLRCHFGAAESIELSNEFTEMLR